MYFVGISVADIRKEPKFESERDSQLIYGEEVRVISSHSEYSLIEGRDGLQGYMKSRLIVNGKPRTHKLKASYIAGTARFPFGSYVSKEDVDKYGIPRNILTGIGNFDFSVPDLSRSFLGIPYLWGGTSDFGFDCSGFVQRLYRFIGKELPRNADWQRDFTADVPGFEKAIPGDLVFFKNHVALYLGNNIIIHANGYDASISMTDLSDESEYSGELLSIFEKIGRVQKSL